MTDKCHNCGFHDGEHISDCYFAPDQKTEINEELYDGPTPDEVCLHSRAFDCCECQDYCCPNPTPCGEDTEEE